MRQRRQLGMGVGLGVMGRVRVRPTLPCRAQVQPPPRPDAGATPLHWAVAGTRRRPNGFGTGGHLSTAAMLVTHGADVRAATHDGNSVVHWCSWAGGVPLLRWLVGQLQQEGEDAHDAVAALNHKGCSAAHWAASGGDRAVCSPLGLG